MGVKGAVKAAGAGGAAPAPAAGAAKAVAAAPKVVGEPKTYAEAMSSMGGLGVSGFTGVLGLSRAWMITACVAESLAFASGVCAIGVSWTAITYPVGYSQFAYTPQTVYFGPLVMNVCGVQTSVLADTCLQSFYFSLYATLGLPEPITINMTYTAGVLAFAAACIALGCVLQLAAAVATGHAAKAILASTAMGVSKRCRGVGTALSAANLSLAGFSSSMLGCLICWGQFAPSTVLMTGTATPLPGFPNTRNAYYGEYLAGLMILSSSLAAGLAVAYKCRLRKEAKVAQPKGVVKAVRRGGWENGTCRNFCSLFCPPPLQVLVDFLGAPAEQNCFC